MQTFGTRFDDTKPYELITDKFLLPTVILLLYPTFFHHSWLLALFWCSPLGFGHL